jgi:hypothetical protein
MIARKKEFVVSVLPITEKIKNCLRVIFQRKKKRVMTGV